MTDAQRSSLAFFMSVAAWGQLLDGLTRAVMPDSAELNPISQALGGPGGILAKCVLLWFLFWLALTFRRDWWVRPLLLFAGVVGIVGMATNVAVLTDG